MLLCFYIEFSDLAQNELLFMFHLTVNGRMNGTIWNGKDVMNKIVRRKWKRRLLQIHADSLFDSLFKVQYCA